MNMKLGIRIHILVRRNHYAYLCYTYATVPGATKSVGAKHSKNSIHGKFWNEKNGELGE